MAKKSAYNLYLIIAIVICGILLLPYLGVFDLVGSSEEHISDLGNQKFPRRELNRELLQEVIPTNENEKTKNKHDQQKKRMAEIEQLLN